MTKEVEGWLETLCAVESEARDLRGKVEAMSRGRLDRDERRLLEQARGELERIERQTGRSLQRSFGKLGLDRTKVCGRGRGVS